ncbi:DNA polymerase III subunit gamma/tau [Candidatus Chloroploca asiatica]|uniref:DNA polymerase III subunit gamma/tau n=1 Tax=Candidatus Chloroploca asiatica TaxID=1506545 RepID=A0A2H3L2G9_9CHLR|nr:DNA polymerase III subunit gamma/tau [Candidatus Chloroploca asiatica]PDV98940.1 DNA polymerase III, subunit gamma and tau [Candidatus Chloroploca asiatica]
MAAQSLYRKWRSQTFDELVGQEHVVQTLRNAIVDERVAHAYLFTGPRGVGKTSMARLLSKAVNCLAPDPAHRPCGTCPACVSIAEGRAVDVIEMDAASNTSVEDARELIERVQFRPAELRTKVYTIDECHMLSTAAFNALLKTLEEPPDHAIFILATTEVHKVPATILSRCQRFTFTRHGIASTAVHLRRVAEAEALALEEGVPEAIARASTGSMRDALGVLEQLASFTTGTIGLAEVHSLLGMTSAAEVYALIEALLDASMAEALRAINGVADQGADLRQFARDLVERLRALLLLLASGDQALADVGADELQLLATWAPRADIPRLLHWIKLFSGLDYQLRTTPYGHLPLELAVVEALVTPVVAAPSAPPRATATPSAPRATPPPARPRPAAPPLATPPPVPRPAPPRQEAPAHPVTPPTEQNLPPTGGVAAAEHAEDAAQASAQAVPAQQAAPDEVPHEGTRTEADPPPTVPRPARAPRSPDEAAAANADFSVLEQIEHAWEEIKRDVRPKSPTVQALLHSVRPVDVEGATIVLLASSAFHKENLEKIANRRIVEDVISRQLGGTYGIRCTIEARAEVQDLRGKIREARKDDLVRAAMNIFEAHIVDIETDEG